MLSEQQDLVLASGSPRRRLLLGMAGYEFDVVSPDIDEFQLPGEAPEDFVVRMAAEKAAAVAEQADRGTCVLGFDTAVVLDDRVFGKPDNAREAAEMLLMLAGRTHTVITGYCLRVAGGTDEERGIDAARVAIRPVSTQEAADYAASGEPLDKAGAYALQGKGGGFVTSVEGLRSTVIGLPLEHVVDLLTRRGIMPRGGDS